MTKVANIIVFAMITMVFYSCHNDSSDVNVENINVSLDFKRFEKDLFEVKYSNDTERVKSMRARYGQFFDLFVFKMLSIPEVNDSVTADNLTKFINDSEIRDSYRLTDSAFKNIDDIKSGMELFLKHYKYYFPEKSIPSVVTYISAFNYAVITTDSVIGIGLDMFLGPKTEYYPRLGIPLYIFTKFRKEYIIPSAIKAWYQSDYEQASVKSELLSQMIYQGKLLYYVNAMAPGIDDTLKTGYSSQQLNWCRENEASVWSFFIENKLLFNTDPSIYSKFVNEGPSTNGFPKEAPGKIGAWVGWQIVKAYMNKKGNESLTDLLKENDAQKILEISGYKPKK